MQRTMPGSGAPRIIFFFFLEVTPRGEEQLYRIADRLYIARDYIKLRPVRIGEIPML